MAYFQQLPSKKWQAQVQRNGKRVSKTFGSKREAQTWATEQEAQALRENRPEAHTFGDAVDKYKLEVSANKDGKRWENARLEVMRQHFGHDTPLVEIAQPQIAAWRDARLKEVSGSTVVREANLLRHMLQLARLEWHWIEGKPWEGVKMPAENQPRQAIWGWRDIRRVIRAERSGKTAEMQRAFHLALRTGMRLAEVLQAPELYDPATRLVVMKTKTEAVARIPIGRIADRMLLSMPPFTVGANEGSVLFSKLCRELCITGLTFHDARATALTHLAKKVPVEVLAKISRHKNVSLLVNVYYRPKPSDIARLI